MVDNFPKKQQARCAIHFAACDDNDTLVSPRDLSSWITLFEAAKIRNHKPILDIAKQLNENEIPGNLMYHRKCRSIFTMKRDLESIKRKSDVTSTETSSSIKRPCRRSSSETRVYDPICIFCSKDKYLKDTRSREKVIKAVQLRADETLRRCAILKEDPSIIAVTSRDIVAAEAHYHASCYKSYTNLSKFKTLESNKKEVDESDLNENLSYEVAEVEAYANLFSYIRNVTLLEGKIVPVAKLTEMLDVFMSSKGKALRISAKKNIRRRFETEFGDSIHIFSNQSGKLLLVPDSLSLKDVVLQNDHLVRELQLWKAKVTDSNKVIDQASPTIRESIKGKMTQTPWPYHPSCVPTAIPTTFQLHRFFIGLLTGDPDNENPADRICRLVESFEQDVIYAVTRGQYKPTTETLSNG